MLELSAIGFLIPTIYAWSKKNIDYGNGFFFLFLTSYTWHCKTKLEKLENSYFWWIDQFCVLNIVLIGSYNYYTYCNNLICKILIPILCLTCFFLYIYNEVFVDDDRIHLIIHTIAIITHCMIIYMIIPNL